VLDERVSNDCHAFHSGPLTLLQTRLHRFAPFADDRSGRRNASDDCGARRSRTASARRAMTKWPAASGFTTQSQLSTISFIERPADCPRQCLVWGHTIGREVARGLLGRDLDLRIRRDKFSCSSTRLGTHRYSGDDSQSGCGTQANTYSDRTRSQGANSDPGEGFLLDVAFGMDRSFACAERFLASAALCRYGPPVMTYKANTGRTRPFRK
jgi:hypothetical protein